MSRTRSQFIAALTGGLVVAVVMAVLPAVAVEGEPLVLGEKNLSATVTRLNTRGGLRIDNFKVGNPALILNVADPAGAPFQVNATGLVDNLNADLLDGQEASAFAADGHDHGWAEIVSGIPAGLADGDDDTLAGLSCDPGQTAKWNPGGTAWECADDTDTDTNLSDGEVFTAVIGQDGTGSGLDADLLDGHESGFFGQQGLTCPPGESLVGRGPGGPICSSPIGVVGIDETDSVGQYASLVLDSDGNPVMAYYDTTNNALKVAVCGDPACSSVTVRTVDDTAGSMGKWASLVLDADDNPRISYQSDPATGDSGLKLAACNDPTCTSPTLRLVDNPLNQTVGDHSSMLLDGDGYPVIAYHSTSSGKLKLAHCGDATCSTVTVTDVYETGSVGRRASLALDVDGNPIISFIDYVPDGPGTVDLWVAHCTDPDCATAPTLTEVIVGDVIPASRSMMLDAAGNPIVAFWDRAGDDLKVLHCDDPTCATSSIEVVDSAAEVGSDLSMVLNAMGYPVIAYQDFTTDDLKLALCHDPGCSDATVVTLQSAGDTGDWTSVVLDAAGNPLVAYFHDETDDLRLVALML